MTRPPVFRNPHLDGSSFCWEAGSTGVLLCHGFTATTTEVRLLARTLHEHGYTVAGPLLPGHGTTPEDCNRHTWQDWLTSAEQAYQELRSKCHQVVVGGESTGALLALLLAFDHPEAAAILCYAPAIRLKMSKVLTSAYSLLVPFITAIPKAPPRDNNPWKGYTVNPLKGARQLLHLQKVIPPVLPQITQPILILQGRLDPRIHPEASQYVYDKVGSSVKELHWLEHSTHCVILDKERDLAASMSLDFLKRLNIF